MREEVQGNVGHGRFFREVNLKIRNIFGMLPAVSFLNIDITNLYPEVAIIAYHFHWSREECMAMSRKERHCWIKEIEKINRVIAKSMKIKSPSRRANR